VQRAEPSGHGRVQHPAHRNRHRVDQRDLLDAHSPRRRGHLGADEPGPDDHQRAAAPQDVPQQAVAQRGRLVQAAQQVHAGRPAPRRGPGPGPGGDDHVVVAQPFAVGQFHGAAGHVEPARGPAEEQPDPEVAGAGLAEQPDAGGVGRAGQQALGQRRLVVRKNVFLAGQHDVAVVPGRPQGLGRPHTADRRADDDGGRAHPSVTVSADTGHARAALSARARSASGISARSSTTTPSSPRSNTSSAATTQLA
jgi:hypothetical protein